jgi:hypothetical protein
MYKYYIVLNQNINKDKIKENLILRYKDDKFLVALPFNSNFTDIDKYFLKAPKIPKKYYAVYTYYDYNKDKVKDHIIHIFNMKDKYILSLPIYENNFMKGGQYNPPYNQEYYQPQELHIVQRTSFSDNLQSGFGIGAGAAAGDAVMEGIANSIFGSLESAFGSSEE